MPHQVQGENLLRFEGLSVRKAPIIAAALLGLMAWRPAAARAVDAMPPDLQDTPGAGFDPLWIELQVEDPAPMPLTGEADPADDPQRMAFLRAIMWAEGTASAPDPYRVCYGYRHTLRNLAQHPTQTGEWGGELLSDAQCEGAGLRPPCRSTAAGAFQINGPTWVDRALVAGDPLPDFGPASQRRFAWRIVRHEGAEHLIDAGRLADAVARLRRRWASLPGAGYRGQPERSPAALVAQFEAAGGVLA